MSCFKSSDKQNQGVAANQKKGCHKVLYPQGSHNQEVMCNSKQGGKQNGNDQSGPVWVVQAENQHLPIDKLNAGEQRDVFAIHDRCLWNVSEFQPVPV